jgi:hypothetical protein
MQRVNLGVDATAKYAMLEADCGVNPPSITKVFMPDPQVSGSHTQPSTSRQNIVCENRPLNL